MNIAKELYRITRDGSVVVWIVADRTVLGNQTGSSLRQALTFKDTSFKLWDTMVFEKEVRVLPEITAAIGRCGNICLSSERAGLER